MEQGLTYVPFNLKTVRMVLLADASFTNAKGLKSQLGHVLLMVDDDSWCNIIHFGSNKCKRIARSVMAAEIHSLALVFYMAYAVRDLVEEKLGRHVPMEAMVYSKARVLEMDHRVFKTWIKSKSNHNAHKKSMGQALSRGLMFRVRTHLDMKTSDNVQQ